MSEARLFDGLERRSFLHTETFEGDDHRVWKRWANKVTVELTRDEFAAFTEALLFNAPIRKEPRQ